MAAKKMATVAPFDNPVVKRKQALQAKLHFGRFNIVAMRLLEEMQRIYPTDIAIGAIATEMSKIIKDKSKYKIGALVFFREIRKQVKREDGSDCQYIDLLAEHSDYAFNDPIPVTTLNGLGLASKWKTMSAELKEGIWVYVDELIGESAEALFCSSKATHEMNQLSQAVMEAGMSGHGGSPRELVSDPRVRETALSFVSTVS